MLLTWLALAISASAGQECASPCCAGSVRAPDPPDAAAPVTPYHRLEPTDTSLDLGIGHLSPARFDWDWLAKMRLPLFDAPDETPTTWIVGGWVMEAGSETPRPMTTDGLVETGYETPSFIVLEVREDGWLRLRRAPGEGRIGTAWTHQCFLEESPIRLRVEPWNERLTSEDISPLYFRARVRHSLRSAPTVDSERLLWIPADSHDYHLEPLETQGDWMRVRLVTPSDYCAEADERTKRIEGWVRWRSDDVGPWLWYYTRGC